MHVPQQESDFQSLLRAAQEAGIPPLDRDPVNSDELIDSLKCSSMGTIMSSISSELKKLERERKKQLHDENIRHNHKFCRKKCKLFKERRCYEKTFEQQCDCVTSQGYLQPEVITPEVVE